MDADQRLKELAISENGFIFDPFSGSTFSVNATGLAIIEELKRGRTRAEVAASLREKFRTEDHDVDLDVDEFVGLLKKHGLLPREFEL